MAYSHESNSEGKQKPRFFAEFFRQSSGERLPEIRFKAALSSEDKLSPAEQQTEHDRLLQAIGKAKPEQHRRIYPAWYRVAAAVALLVAFAALYRFQWGSQQRLVTAYGETRQVWLPDGSQAVLNANSSLTFSRDWQAGQPRQVYLQGEAFFLVRKQPTPAGGTKFTVRTDGWEVEVLGTAFNVFSRREKRQVVLEHGRVRLRATAGTIITMRPGELVEQLGGNAPVHRVVDPEEFSAWRNREIVFHDTPLRQIAQKIEELHGVRVVIANSAPADVKLTGTYPTDNLDLLLKIVAGAAGVQVAQQGNRVTFY